MTSDEIIKKIVEEAHDYHELQDYKLSSAFYSFAVNIMKIEKYKNKEAENVK